MSTIITIIAFIPLILSSIALGLSVIYAYKTISVRNREIKEARMRRVLPPIYLSDDDLEYCVGLAREVEEITHKKLRYQMRRKHKAYDVYLKVFGSDHPKTKIAKGLLDEVNQKLNN